MKFNSKKIVSVLLASAMMLFAAPSVSAATATAAKPYSVLVKQGQVHIVQSGKVVNSYDTTATNLVLTSDKSHELHLQFPNIKGTTTTVTLGRQKSLTLSGAMDSLAIRSALPNDINLIIAKDTEIEKLLHYSSNSLTVNGTINLFSVYSTAYCTLAKTGSAKRVQLRDSGSHLNALGTISVLEKVKAATAVGTGVQYLTPLIREEDSTDWGTSKKASSKELTLRAETLYALQGDTLWALEHDLDNAVRARDSYGNTVYGDVEFNLSGSTVLKSTRTVKYTFHPDDHTFKSTVGTIQIRVNKAPTPTPTPTPTPSRAIYVFSTLIETFAFPDMRLGALTTDLNYAAYAMDANGYIVTGTVQWSYPSQRVVESGSYRFVFYPDDSSRYQTATGEAYVSVIYVEGGNILGKDQEPTLEWGNVPEIGQGAAPESSAIGQGAAPESSAIGQGAASESSAIGQGAASESSDIGQGASVN